MAVIYHIIQAQVISHKSYFELDPFEAAGAAPPGPGFLFSIPFTWLSRASNKLLGALVKSGMSLLSMPDDLKRRGRKHENVSQVDIDT